VPAELREAEQKRHQEFYRAEAAVTVSSSARPDLLVAATAEAKVPMHHHCSKVPPARRWWLASAKSWSSGVSRMPLYSSRFLRVVVFRQLAALGAVVLLA
jgi:hypothetical protein